MSSEEGAETLRFLEVRQLIILEGSVAEKGVTMKIKPLADRILVKRLEEEEVVRGGIIIPSSSACRESTA